MLLIIDNYDSFTYNLVQYFGELGAEPVVKRNDEITLAEIEALEAGCGRHLARALHAEGGGHFQRGHRARSGQSCPCSGCAWDTSASGMFMAARWCARGG